MTSHLPEPDLVIRTSGEKRLSNFLLWQIAYSELYFTKTQWPDFDVSRYMIALKNFINRKRRYGGIDGKRFSVKVFFINFSFCSFISSFFKK